MLGVVVAGGGGGSVVVEGFVVGVAWEARMRGRRGGDLYEGMRGFRGNLWSWEGGRGRRKGVVNDGSDVMDLLSSSRGNVLRSGGRHKAKRSKTKN